jgi:hypothetical protein
VIERSLQLCQAGFQRSRALLGFGGQGNFDRNVLDDPRGAYEAHSLRLFDAEAKQWSIYWLDARFPSLDAPVVGRFTGRKGEFWFTRVSDAGAFHAGMKRATAGNEWTHDVAPRLEQFEERATQVLMLAPTPRSALRRPLDARRTRAGMVRRSWLMSASLTCGLRTTSTSRLAARRLCHSRSRDDPFDPK